MNYFSIFILINSILFNCFEQIDYPKIGKKMPFFEIDDFHEQSGKIFTNADLIGNHTILIFWTRGCKTCLSEFPKYNFIQEKFGGDIQLLLIGYDDSKIRDVYSNYKDTLILNFDSAYANKDGFEKFGVRSVPTYIWIDQEGIVTAVTRNEDFNENNINLFVNKREFVFFNFSLDAQVERAAVK